MVEGFTLRLFQPCHPLILPSQSYLGAAVKSMTGMGLPGADIFEGESPSDPAFGLRKLAVCSTTAGKLYALDMADGAIAW